jgi:hypothetical protein
MKRLLVVAAAAATLFTAEAQAEGFIGFSGGQSQWPKEFCFDGCDRHDTTWAARGGWMFTPWVGIEARYVDLGETRSHQPYAGSAFDWRFNSKGAGVGAVFAVPFGGSGFGFNAVAGVARMKTTVDSNDITVPTQGEGGSVTLVGVRGSVTSTEPYAGVGFDYRFNPNLSAGLEATRYRTKFFGDRQDVDAYTASITYRFR